MGKRIARSSMPRFTKNLIGAADAVKQSIIGFQQDDELHWVATLECGHTQHVRHNPPWTNRPWVVTEAGRQAALGQQLSCRKCDREI
jgi:Protein of unknown function (DUF3565)